jgi:hypothetical protein
MGTRILEGSKLPLFVHEALDVFCHEISSLKLKKRKDCLAVAKRHTRKDLGFPLFSGKWPKSVVSGDGPCHHR